MELQYSLNNLKKIAKFTGAIENLTYPCNYLWKGGILNLNHYDHELSKEILKYSSLYTIVNTICDSDKYCCYEFGDNYVYFSSSSEHRTYNIKTVNYTIQIANSIVEYIDKHKILSL